MPLDVYLAKALLDWSTGAATVTRPTGLFVGVENGTPTYSSDSPAHCFRTTASFAPASTAGGGSATASLAFHATMSCSTTDTCDYWGLYASTSGGSRFMYGTLAAQQTVRAGSNVIFSAGALIIGLA